MTHGVVVHLFRGPGKGQWEPLPRKAFRLAALVKCPLCGVPVPLADHRITARGEIQPQVACLAPGCRFSESVVLEGWEASA